MSVTVVERFDSRKFTTGDNASAELHYLLVGTDDEGEARTALELTAPAGYQGMLRRSVSVEPIAANYWDGLAHYGLDQPQQEDTESQWSFDTSGGSQHIVHSDPSFGTVGKYGMNGDTAPDNGNMIGASAEHVEGCDIVVPVYAFSETHYKSSSFVTEEYKGKLYRMTGTVNDDVFRGCAAGECLFLGAAGTRRGARPWELSYKFAASPNKTGLVIGSITVTSKKGWEYLWVRSIPKVIGTGENAVLTMMPRHAYVHPVYKASDFDDLGIG